MKKQFVILFCLIVLRGTSQNHKLAEAYNLMPWPQTIEETGLKLEINSDLTISINGNETQQRLRRASVDFLRRLSGRTGVFINQGFPLETSSATIQIYFEKVSNLINQSDESYSLEVNSKNVTLKAQTDVELAVMGSINALISYIKISILQSS
jgi:hexosaminidase